MPEGPADDVAELAESLAIRATVEGFSDRRVGLVRRALTEWRQQLIDLTGRNNLLRYRDLKLGTLDLTSGDPETLASLLRGRPAKVSHLFPIPEERDPPARRARAIHKKAKENFEERGLETLYVAAGLATWKNQRGPWEPLAPVLLRKAELHPLGAAQDDFVLTLLDEMELSPTLVHVLRTDYNSKIDVSSLQDRIEGEIDQAWELLETYRWLEGQCAGVRGFHIEPRFALANFSYAKLPMVRDLETNLEEFVAHDLIAAIAGDEAAREIVRSAQPADAMIPHPDDVPPSDEFLVLDADASQNFAINSVLAGESLIIKGPPGTGKSQTISNLISSLVARGSTVLFVAEKRAAIDAVLKRLYQRRLGDLILDLHGGIGSRRAVAQTIGAALIANRAVGPVNDQRLHDQLERDRKQLNEYCQALHEPRSPWDVSYYAATVQIAAIPISSRLEVRFRGEALDRLDADAIEHARLNLSRFARLGGLTLATSGSPWAAADIVSPEEAQRAFDKVDRLRRHLLPTAIRALKYGARATRLPEPEILGDWSIHLALWQDVTQTLTQYQPTIFQLELDRLAIELRPADRLFSRLWARRSSRFRAARKAIRKVAMVGRVSYREAQSACRSAADQLRRWRSLGGTANPAAPENLIEMQGAFIELREACSELVHLVHGQTVANSSPEEIAEWLTSLNQDQTTLIRLPEIHETRTALEGAGLEELLEELEERPASEEISIEALRYAWLQSVIEAVTFSDPIIGAFAPELHERTVEDFKDEDRQHIEATAGRVRRLAAERAIRKRDQFREEESLLQRQASLKRRHMPVRELFERATDVLLALKPCWAMSPLVVSQLLPARPIFDVVIFDEASQITPADAVTSILRGKQLVVAGDERQLPPTMFFLAETLEDQEQEEDLDVPVLAGTQGFESILDSLTSLLRFRMLEWHYRSRDERLIAFSNAHIYGGALTTFPGLGGDFCLRHVLAEWDPTSDTNSPSPEVEAVIDLIFEHATTRPEESLGVIAMGIKHANRIEETLRERLANHSELDEFFDESVEERFFVKNLERVQGDERDAIILSIGYGKNNRGELVYRFGPLLTEGGERRLNVAVTRAKTRLTLVSSFTSKDMDPEKLNSEGMKLVRQYLQYVESEGANLGDRVLDKPALNPFETDVRDTLQKHFNVVPQYGTCGYWIDFVVPHPTQPGRYILAIECDGATYHSCRSARDRDRLRQEQLQRLGWHFHRIWSTDWFRNKDKAVAKTVVAYRNALADVGSPSNLITRSLRSNSPTDPSESPDRKQPPARGPRPPFALPGLNINEYSNAGLAGLADWIESDGYLRTETEVLVEMMRELGFERRGKRITEALMEAIRRARRHRGTQ